METTPEQAAYSEAMTRQAANIEACARQYASAILSGEPIAHVHQRVRHGLDTLGAALLADALASVIMELAVREAMTVGGKINE